MYCKTLLVNLCAVGDISNIFQWIELSNIFRVSDTQLWRVKWITKKSRRFSKCTLVQELRKISFLGWKLLVPKLRVFLLISPLFPSSLLQIYGCDIFVLIIFVKINLLHLISVNQIWSMKYLLAFTFLSKTQNTCPLFEQCQKVVEKRHQHYQLLSAECSRNIFSSYPVMIQWLEISSTCVWRWCETEMVTSAGVTEWVRVSLTII